MQRVVPKRLVQTKSGSSRKFEIAAIVVLVTFCDLCVIEYILCKYDLQHNDTLGCVVSRVVTKIRTLKFTT
jgi:hypothetical protein